jgi:glycosyltransferase involved in cell wall biosynthesis
MKLKVCFIGGARYTQPLDGTNRKKFQTLQEIGELFVIGFSQDLRPRRFREYAHFYLFPQLPLPIMRYVEMFTLGVVLMLWLIVRYGVQVLVTQSPYEGVTAAIARKVAGLFRYKVALVVESHGDFEESIFLQRRILIPGFYRFLMHHVAGFALKQADVLRAISDSVRSQLERRAPGKPILQFIAWTDIDAFFKAGINSHKTTNTIVYVGVLIPGKGVHFLIDAFSQVSNDFPAAKLLLIGNQKNIEYAQLLKARVTEIGLSGHVVFIEHMPQQELAEYMSKAHALVLSSLSEGLGLVVIEAMATGTPVIGSRVGGIPEMIQDGVTGFLVPAGDVEALGERIRWVLTHHEEAKEMGQQARKFARQFFSHQAYKKNYAQLFEMAQKQSAGR